MSDNNTYITLTTAMAPGAIAIIQVTGKSAKDIVLSITNKDEDIAVGSVSKVAFTGIDEGIINKINENSFQIMPHGGRRVVQKLIDKLIEAGAIYNQSPCAKDLYPEANSAIEADVLEYCAKAISPLALDILAKQPRLWEEFVENHKSFDSNMRQSILAQAQILDRLIDPPLVALVGKPNVGKSTLTNLLFGRNASLTADLPGTTRDWVGGLVEINYPYLDENSNTIESTIALRWMDTPGLRLSSDNIEQSSIDIARQEFEKATVIISMRDIDTNWPEDKDLPRKPDVWVVNKVDKNNTLNTKKIPISSKKNYGKSKYSPILISAKNNIGIDKLNSAIITALELDVINSNELWAFTTTLKKWAKQQLDSTYLAQYLRT